MNSLAASFRSSLGRFFHRLGDAFESARPTVAVGADTHAAAIASTEATLQAVVDAIALIDVLGQTYADTSPSVRETELGVALLDDLRPMLLEFAEELESYLTESSPDDLTFPPDCEEAALDALRRLYPVLDQCEAELRGDA